MTLGSVFSILLKCGISDIIKRHIIQLNCPPIFVYGVDVLIKAQ